MISLAGLMGDSVKLGKMDVKLGQVVSNPYARAFAPQVNEGEDSDYEVSMAAKQLDDIIKSATELKAKMGQKEFNVAAWIQDHISKSQDYINQANYGFDKNEIVEDDNKKEISPAEKVQNINNRIKVLQAQINAQKDPTKRTKIQATLRKAMQSLSAKK